MKFWECIGKVFLFGWLFGRAERGERCDGGGVSSRGQSFGRSASQEVDWGRWEQPMDDFCEEQDDYDVMDDF